MATLIPKSPLFIGAGASQPARRDFGITEAVAGKVRAPVYSRDAVVTPFCTLTEFAASGIAPKADFLVVAPLYGHFPILLRDLVLGLLPDFRVYVTDWLNVRHIPVDEGPFGLESNVACVLDIVKKLAPGLNVIALCQAGVPAFAATALLASHHDPHTPSALIFIAAPIDPLANPTHVVQLLRSRPLSWFETNVITAVPEIYPGSGRHVYPANLHLIPLWAYLTRRVSEGGEIASKILFDDGADPGRFPFLDLYTSIMDLDAKFFLENTGAVFQDCLLRRGTLRFQGELVEPKAIQRTALLTIEGELDDIAAPRQTDAAHGLFTSLAGRFHHRILVAGSGHFSLFYGNTWRREVLPAIQNFWATTLGGAQPGRALVLPHSLRH